MARKVTKGNGTVKQADLALQYTCTALYVRVSTQSQADEGYSLEAVSYTHLTLPTSDLV